MPTRRNVAVMVAVMVSLIARVTEAQAAEPEPEFDHGLVVGTVFCDEDGNGKRDAGEMGLGGVDIVADHGFEVTSDRDGRWHLRRFEPGQHLVKLDETTLPPGAAATTEVSRTVLVTGGLIARVHYGVRCSYDRVLPDLVEAPESEGPVSAMSTEALASTVTISGRMKPLTLSVDGHRVPILKAQMKLKGPKATKVTGGYNLGWEPGPLSEPLTIRCRTVTDGPPVAPATWQIDVTKVGDETEESIRTFFGKGAPPGFLGWDGTDPAEILSVLEQGGLYRVRLRVGDGQGGLSTSRPRTFGIGYGQGGGVVDRQVIRGTLFDSAMRPTKELIRQMRPLRAILQEHPAARVLIEVHTDDAEVPDIALSRSRKGAFLAAEMLGRVLALDRDRIDAIGYGSLRPLVPNINARNRAVNRRIEVTVLVRPESSGRVTLPSPLEPRGVRVQGKAIRLGSDGSFIGTVPRPATGLLSLQVVTAGSMVWERVLDVGGLADTPGGASPEDDPLRSFGGTPLRRALGDPLIRADEGDSPATASELEVYLPPADSLVSAARIWVFGTTHTSNVLTINGKPVDVDSQGRFGSLIALPPGVGALEIVSTDPGGFKAKITRGYQVTDKAYFLLGLVDTAVGQLGAHLPGRGAHTATTAGSLLLQGRGALTFKGRIRGSALAKELFVTAHVDTAKREDDPFTAFYDQMVDPTRDYPVFGDTSSDGQGSAARGPLYVLVTADRSHVVIGNMRTDLEGIDLLRYDRALYGVLAHVEHAFQPGWDTRVRAFASDDTKRMARGHDELRATGGSLYYVSRHSVVEGSERVQVVVRERDSRVVLSRTTLIRDRDYRMDYRDGRISLKSALSSTLVTPWSLGGVQPLAVSSRQVLAGHETWLVVDYESRERSEDSKMAGGVHVRQKLGEAVSVGAGFVTETRETDSYSLYGGDIQVTLAEGTEVHAEVATSRGIDGSQRVSQDGGLRWEASQAAQGEETPEGLAVKLSATSDVGKLMGDDLALKVRGWWEMRDPAFHGVGQVQDQGTERYGAVATYEPTDKDQLVLRFDGSTALEANDAFVDGQQETKRLLSVARYQRRMGRWTLRSEGGFGQHRDSAVGKSIGTGGVLLGGSYRLTDSLEASLSQQGIFGGDDGLLGEGMAPRLTTRTGLGWRVVDGLTLGLGHALRWDGDSAVILGARTRLDDQSDAYVEHRFVQGDASGEPAQAMVVGTETRLPGGGRTYSEYRLDSGVDGRTNRAVVGIGRRLDVTRGVRLQGLYERSQTFGGFEGTGSRDVVSGGLELLPWDWLKFGGRYEVRLDQAEALGGEPARDVVQALMTNGATIKLSTAWTTLLMMNYGLTQNLTNRSVERETLSGTWAAIYRPLAHDGLLLTGRFSRYQRRYDTPGADVPLLEGEETPSERDTIDLLGLGAIVELPLRIQLTERVAYRYRVLRAGDDPRQTSQDLLWLNRIGYHVMANLDLAFEYRMLMLLSADDSLEPHHGLLAELAYVPTKHLRVGLGYDFSSIPRDLEPGQEDDPDGGIFLRVTGTY